MKSFKSRENQLKELRSLYLAESWANTCHQCEVELETPVFVLTGGGCYGSWQAESRTLSISEELMLAWPWTVVEQVLRHEMAHQLVSERPELLSGSAGCCHGAGFKEACELLRVELPYRRARVNLRRIVEDAEAWRKGRDSPFSRIFSRVEKLLALAGSDNPHEAELALARAQELSIKYHLERIDPGAKEVRHVRTRLLLHRRNVARWQRFLGAMIRENFPVEVILLHSFDAASGMFSMAVDILGRPENVKVGEYCWRFIENHVARLWQRDRVSLGRLSRSQRGGYFVGVVQGFSDKMKLQREAASGVERKTPEEAALVVLADHCLAEYVQWCYPRLRTTVARGGLNRVGYVSGRAAGRELNFMEGMTEGPTGTLLPRGRGK
ncbi:MAG: DUF2786 domain-containing protein [Desulforhopalus sp.]|nr:DUF2786 domain-containing protein [Desulforhopalus sp.]